MTYDGDGAWCDYSDLPKSTCSHCLGHSLDPMPKDPPMAFPGTKVEAAHGGECACCGKGYLAGTEIARITDGWAIAHHTKEPDPIDFSDF